MISPADKIIITSEEAAELCGREIIFEELRALYGSTILKPLRTLPNGSSTWSTAVVKATVAKAQSDGSLNDRSKVDAALKLFRASRNTKAREATPCCS